MRASRLDRSAEAVSVVLDNKRRMMLPRGLMESVGLASESRVILVPDGAGRIRLLSAAHWLDMLRAACRPLSSEISLTAILRTFSRHAETPGEHDDADGDLREVCERGVVLAPAIVLMMLDSTWEIDGGAAVRLLAKTWLSEAAMVEFTAVLTSYAEQAGHAEPEVFADTVLDRLRMLGVQIRPSTPEEITLVYRLRRLAASISHPELHTIGLALSSGLPAVLADTMVTEMASAYPILSEHGTPLVHVDRLGMLRCRAPKDRPRAARSAAAVTP